MWPWARSNQWPLEWSGQAKGVAMSQVRPMAIGMTRPLSEQQVWPWARSDQWPLGWSDHWVSNKWPWEEIQPHH
jgi:hypothetical protein